jgi:hypothetical protein
MTDALSGNNALLFAPAYTHLWERSGVQVDFSEAPIGSQAGVPGFSTNEITFRAEGRWGLVASSRCRSSAGLPHEQGSYIDIPDHPPL